MIIMTFNRPEAIRRCLASLQEQTCGRGVFEVIVLDVSDSPVTELVEPFCSSLNLRHVVESNAGVAGNRNIGARHASSALLAFLDDDCVADPAWLETLLARADEHPGALVGGSVRNMHPGNAVSTAGQVITEAVDAHFNSVPQGPTFFPGMNFLVPRDGYLDIGGCDASFGRLAAEDRDFMTRWRRSGREMISEPAAVVTHEHRKDLAGFVRQYFNYGKGAWAYHRKMVSLGDCSMGDAVHGHLRLLGHLRKAVSGCDKGMKARVAGLLVVWEISNLAGFGWQAVSSKMVSQTSKAS